MFATAQTLLHLAATRWADRRHRQPVAATGLPADWLPTLRAEGILVIPDFYSAATCAALRAEVDRLLLAYPATVQHLPDDDRILGAERVSPLVADYHHDRRLHTLAAAYHQAPLLNLFTLANRVHPEPGGLGSGGGWHRDSVHQPQFKTLLYLTDVAQGQGAYQYLAGSHTPAALLQLVRSGAVGFDQNRLTEAEIAAVQARAAGQFPLCTVLGRAGTLVVTDTRGLHRGQPVTEGLRYALTNYFFARHYLSAKSEARFRALFVDRQE